MEYFDDTVLQAIPDPAMVVQKGRVLCFNSAAAQLFPDLACDIPAPDPLPKHAGAGGFLTTGDRSWHLTSAPLGAGLLILFHPAPAQGGIPISHQAGVARCLREQMGQLLLNIQLLSKSATPDNQRQIASMNRSLCQMLRLVNYIDLLGNLEAGSPPFYPVTLDLAGLCRQLTDTAESLLAQAGVSLELDCPVSSLLVCGDSDLLQTLLLELLSNAAQAAGKGGVLRLSLSFRQQRALLTLSGRYIQKDERSLAHLLAGLMDESRIPLPGEGAGIGLALAQRIVRLHQGALLMERQEEDADVAVTLALPMAAPGTRLPVRTPTREYTGGFSPALLAFSSLLDESAFAALDVE